MDPLGGLGRLLMGAGALLLLVGAAFAFGPRWFSWLGRLPGDIVVKNDNFTFYFPLATCVLASIVLSLVAYLLRFLRR